MCYIYAHIKINVIETTFNTYNTFNTFNNTKAVDSGGIYGFYKVTVAELVAYMQLSSNLLSAKIIHF